MLLGTNVTLESKGWFKEYQPIYIVNSVSGHFIVNPVYDQVLIHHF